MQPLMKDSRSPIIDFYPTDFRVDQEGKRNDWEGIVLVPFIDEARLLQVGNTRTPAASNVWLMNAKAGAAHRNNVG